LSAFTESVVSELAELRIQSELRKEETDVLSWVTAAVSRDAGVTFADLKAPAASLMAGKELADLVRQPGILAARSLLQGIIPPLKGKAADRVVTLLAAVNATERTWREAVAQASAVEAIADLCPVLGAIKASLTTDEAEGWVGAYKKSYGIDPNAPVQPIELSFQIHRECLLTKIG
jgi:GTPase-associated system helical domain